MEIKVKDMIIERIKSGAETVASEDKNRTIQSPTSQATTNNNPDLKSAIHKVVYPANFVNSDRESDRKRHASPIATFTDSNESDNASIRCDDMSDLQESDEDYISNSRYKE